MMNDLFAHLILSGLLLSVLLTPLGCHLMWNRMAFLSDTLSHSAILGTAIGMILHLPLMVSCIIFLCLFALIFHFLSQKKALPKDTSLSLLSYGGMSAGIVLLHIFCGDGIYKKILFGDLYALENQDMIILALLTCVVNGFLFFYEKGLILSTLDGDYAKTSGIPVERLRITFLMMTAFTVGFSIYCVGSLIVPALLIIPCCAVHGFSVSYKHMIKNALVFSCMLMPLSVYFIKTTSMPLGPTTVIIYLIGFALLKTVRHIFGKKSYKI